MIIFEPNNALDVGSAQRIDELALRPAASPEEMMRTRDLKPYALQILVEADVILETDGGTRYLLQDKLAAIDMHRL